jgi:hypothetical protein
LAAFAKTSETNPSATVLAEARKFLDGFMISSPPIRTVAEIGFPLAERQHEIQAGKLPVVLKTGLGTWDAVCGGLPPTLIVISAAPQVGKSALLAAMCVNIAKHAKVGILSLEDEGDWLYSRVVANEAKVPVFLLGNEKLTPEQLERFDIAAAKGFEACSNILCCDTHGMKIPEVLAAARRMVADGAKAIFVDHLGEIRLDRTERHDRDVGFVVSELRGLSKAFHIPVVLACHPNRNVENIFMPPGLTDFAFTADVERMARLAVGLYRVHTKILVDRKEVETDQLDTTKIAAIVLKQTRGRSNVGFEMNLSAAAGLVVDSPASYAASKMYQDF